MSQTCHTQDPQHVSQRSAVSHCPGCLPHEVAAHSGLTLPRAHPKPAQGAPLWLGPQSTPSALGINGILLSRPLGGPKSALSPQRSRPSTAPNPAAYPAPPGPRHLSSPGPVASSLAPSLAPSPPRQVGSRGSPPVLRDRCHPILAAPASLRTGASLCAGALCCRARRRQCRPLLALRSTAAVSSDPGEDSLWLPWITALSLSPPKPGS